ncbi:MAG: NTP transferase domain-containing protein [Methanomassiliicoccales archaeon]|nr:NTP transferase domain-containing protein [Methanomassiliicoccales archaeon]
MPQLSAVVVAGGNGVRSGEVRQETAMISTLGRPSIDYVLEALRGCREVSEVIVSVTGSTPLTEAHVRSRGYPAVSVPESRGIADLGLVMQLVSTPFVLVVPANLPLLRSESIDSVVDAFYRSKRSSLVVGVPIDDVQEIITDPTTVMDMDGVRAAPCGVRIMDRGRTMGLSPPDVAYLVTDLEDFDVAVDNVGELEIAERILSARQRRRIPG